VLLFEPGPKSHGESMATDKPSNKQIEERYIEEDMQISQERSDFLLPQVLDFVAQKKWMNLQPEYQRRQVWDRPSNRASSNRY